MNHEIVARILVYKPNRQNVSGNDAEVAAAEKRSCLKLCGTFYLRLMLAFSSSSSSRRTTTTWFLIGQ